MAERRIKQLLKEIERLLHWSNEDPMLAVKYRPVINYKIRLVKQYQAINKRRIA